MARPQQTPYPKGWSRLEQLPPGALWTIAEFVGDIAIVTQSETADNFTETVLDSSAANAWEPDYNDLQSLALVSTSFRYPAQRALFRVAVLKTTGGLMRFLRSLLMYPDNRCRVRYMVAAIADHIRTLPIRDINHAIEDQVLTTVVQSCKNITAVRLCFGEPRRYPAPPGPVGVNINQIAPNTNTFLYSSLVYNFPQHLTCLTLDFGAIYSIANFRLHEPGYPTGLPPTIERLTLVGNRVESELPYYDFTIESFADWLRTNHELRELRLADDFDKMVRYNDRRATVNDNPNPELVRSLTWNDILLRYQNTLEVLEMGWDRPSALGMKARFGESGMLDCLPEMRRLRFLKAPLITLGGDFIVPLGDDGKVIDSVRTGFPNSLKKLDLLVVNPPKTRAERADLKWRVVECLL
ncbi:hypothetical protein QBC45DRAFT_456743 [Copromyces sp. CBS 386.78]|nr:hypothetical protein QBC45DRAFT_456743 [Copromyces sp. CBS 386.78]